MNILRPEGGFRLTLNAMVRALVDAECDDNERFAAFGQTSRSVSGSRRI